ncbi:DNA/RNA non-specific endonuclease [Gemmata sp. G18]|uniref:DNA/RNA non-specific endonuclease n=1 Tax=Gemmata palustris TaxID=2822762 RepID=A0ABS5BKS9_9BACT|nr:DNA/RNA non-specific endonuclease [Gemmata palustris]MBP3954087.1 DNA/RNA non-specific endonuclease [Gemmata palustris]
MSSLSRTFTAVLADTELMAEIRDRSKKTLAAHRPVLDANEVALAPADYRAVMEGRPLPDADAQDYSEAIVLLDGRPSLLVRNDSFEEPELEYWQTRLNPSRAVLESALRSVGRVELTGHTTYEWVGTAWVIGDRLVATNRHVANVFAQGRGQGFVFRPSPLGGSLTARIDFKEEYQTGAIKEVPVTRVLYIAPDEPGQPDMAVLELGTADELPGPVQLAASSRIDGPVAVVGYPAWDSRNGEDAMRNIFRDIYDVKRLAPGYLMPAASATDIQHNCSTLGGNSGSAVLDVQTGAAVGLHFGGRFKTANFAVKAEVIRSVLDRLPASRPGIAVPGGTAPEAPTTASLAGREGYRPDFLGTGRRVRLPILSSAQEDDAVSVPGRDDFVLAYTHFSVVMCRSRRLCYFTAVNIDGNQSLNLRRADNWFLDPRIPADAQSGNELYRNNNLDRGHMVRRLDPVWGSAAVAKAANNDTFFYTNSCPQHKDLNQRTWNDLEDYILNNTDQRNLKVSVFTGPVLAPADPVYRGTRIPLDYWKVVAMVKTDGKLSATAYMLTQRNLQDDFEAPFVFGPFRTYQVPIARVEDATGLSFGNLSDFDPLAGTETAAPAPARELTTASDLVL